MRRFWLLLPLLFCAGSLHAQQVATDNFMRANGGFGANWTTMDSAPQIAGDLANGGGAAGPQYDAFWNANSFNNNQYAQVTINNITSTANISAIVRATATNNGYFALVKSLGTGTDIYKEVSGSFTLLNSTAQTWSNGDVLLFSVVGTTLTVCRNGSSVLTQADSTFASGAAGLSLGDTNQFVSLWSGGNMTTAGCTIPTGTSGGGGFGGKAGIGGKAGFGD